METKLNLTEEDKMNWKNQTIWTGDNLPIMRGMNSGCVDLIYLDPPFNSNHDYSAPIGSEAAGAAFKDTWGLADIDVSWLQLIEEQHPKVHKIISASLSKSDMAYLIYMAPRLIEMRRLLKDTGSVYLHCDPTMSHYLKLLMDAIFGRDNFRNEIIWCYTGPSGSRKNFPSKHDTIFRYTKSDTWVFNGDDVRVPYKDLTVQHSNQERLVGFDKLNKDKVDEYKARGKLPESWWPNISPVGRIKNERQGYPTQKPLALLERIIKASSNKGDTVLDPFCGCATTCIAAQRLGRNWVGIDLSSKAVQLTKMRMNKEVVSFSSHHKGIHRTDIPKRTDLGKISAYNSPANKKELYGEQAGDCKGCNTHFELRNLEVDHIIASSQGGTDLLENLQLLCGSCNRVKGARGMEYLTMKLNEFNK